MIASASSEGIGFPRCWVTLNCLPRRDCAAVAPSATMTLGLSSRISSCSQGWQARTSAAIGLLVQPAAPLDHDELEVLDRVGHVHPGAVDPGLRHGTVEKFTGRTDKGVPGAVLEVTWCLAHKHDLRPCGAFTEHRLGRLKPEIAAAAAPGCVPQPGQRWFRAEGSRQRNRWNPVAASRSLVMRLMVSTSEPSEKWRRSPSGLPKLGV